MPPCQQMGHATLNHITLGRGGLFLIPGLRDFFFPKLSSDFYPSSKYNQNSNRSPAVALVLPVAGRRPPTAGQPPTVGCRPSPTAARCPLSGICRCWSSAAGRRPPPVTRRCPLPSGHRPPPVTAGCRSFHDSSFRVNVT